MFPRRWEEVPKGVGKRQGAGSGLPGCGLAILHVLMSLLYHWEFSYPKMYRVSENGHPVFCSLRLLSVIYGFGMVLA